MANAVALHPDFIKTLAEEMVKHLGCDESKAFYTEALEKKVDPGKVVKEILYNVKEVRKLSDLNNPAVRRYLKPIAEKMKKDMTVNELSEEVLSQFITIQP